MTIAITSITSSPDFTESKVGRSPAWGKFDAEWYLLRYPLARSQMQSIGETDPEQFYYDHGCRLGHSPNMFFDEKYYLSTYPDIAWHVERGIFRSGFEHYCHDGYQKLSPHWLFSEEFYLRSYPDITQGYLARHGFINGYDHYLELGDSTFRNGHWLFDAMLYRENKPTIDRSSPSVGGSFVQFLAGGCIAGSHARVSWYFDPVWYLTTYPQVRTSIEADIWSCALHHYLCNPTPQDYHALEWFSESFYRSTYPDMQEALENGHFRNAYEHFVRYGAMERRKPHPDVELSHYARTSRALTDLEIGMLRDPFAHWLAHLDSKEEDVTVAPIPEGHTRQLFIRNADAMLSQLARNPLDFSNLDDHPPALSVIMILHNQFALSMAALASLRANFPHPIELIIVDSGSYDDTRFIEDLLVGAKVIRFTYNAGFVQGCNTALPYVTSPVVLYLNNDLLLGNNACQQAITRLFSAPDIGAVGGKIIRTNGLLQEAGSIIWRDGTAHGYLRDADPNVPEANFVRDVDYCSGAFLMLRTELVRQMGGFDDSYRPAYYEDADLCVRLRKAGYRTVYDPAIIVQHLEYGSAGAARSNRMMQRNHEIFVSKHQDYLRYQYPPQADNPVRARSPLYNPVQQRGNSNKSKPLRILFIEDWIPLRHLGSGYGRSNDIVRGMAELGHLVTVFPMVRAPASLTEIYRGIPDMVEVLHECRKDTLGSFLEDRAGYYDIVWVGRTHNLEQLMPIFSKNASTLPPFGFVLDTEAIASSRTFEQNRVLGRPQTESLDQALKRELSCAYFCQKIVTVNALDASLVQQVGYNNISVLGHLTAHPPSPSEWIQRSGLLFLGAIHELGSPNHDSLEWFVTEVLPLVEARLPPDVCFTVAGYIRKDLDLSALSRNPRVELIGPVTDLATLYNRHRVFVAPTRFAGGIPFKVHEAAGYGVPVVATDLLCRQIDWTDGIEIMNGGTDSAEAFAERVVTLYQEPDTWERIRNNALTRVGLDCNPQAYLGTLEAILRDTAIHVEPQ